MKSHCVHWYIQEMEESAKEEPVADDLASELEQVPQGDPAPSEEDDFEIDFEVDASEL